MLFAAGTVDDDAPVAQSRRSTQDSHEGSNDKERGELEAADKDPTDRDPKETHGKPLEESIANHRGDPQGHPGDHPTDEWGHEGRRNSPTKSEIDTEKRRHAEADP